MNPPAEARRARSSVGYWPRAQYVAVVLVVSTGLLLAVIRIVALVVS